MSVSVYIKALVEMGKHCKGSTCLNADQMMVKNRSPKDMDLTLTLEGMGDYTFFIAKGDSIDIQPLPDFCKHNTWGTVKEIKYK